MKKTSYILIIILFIGILFPYVDTYAQTEGVDQCYTQAGEAIPLSVVSNQQTCESLGNSWHGYLRSRLAGPEPAPVVDPEIRTMDTRYNLLAPLPQISSTFDTSQENALGIYLNAMIKLFIGICAVLAVVMIVMGGVEYMTSELLHSKEHGKERITGAVFGLILALGAYALLNTINPDLLKSDFSTLKDVTVKVKLLDIDKEVLGRTEQGFCAHINDPSNLCSPENLEAAGFTGKILARQASAICNGESQGAEDPNVASGADVCNDGSPFSFGLFQINILSHANEIPGGICSNIFTINPNPAGKVRTSSNDNTLGGCLETAKKSDRVCVRYACAVTNPAKYKSCVDFITNPVNNIAYALSLQQRRGWGQWGFNASCRF